MSAFVFALIIAIVICVLACVVKAPRRSRKVAAPVDELVCVNKTTGATANVTVTPHDDRRSRNYDDMTASAMVENSEYFTTCSGGGASPNCPAEDNLESAQWSFGPDGTDYKDFVTSWSVEDAVISSHRQFVEDRKGLSDKGEFLTGRTYSPDSHDSYDPMPWAGIRGRPQYVEQCNPTQVPDIDTNLFKKNTTYKFNSSE